MRLRNDFFERWLAAIAGMVLRHPWKIVGVYVVLAVLSGLAAVRWLELQTDSNALVSNDLEYNRRYLSFEREFGDLEFLYVVIEVRDPRRAMAVADAVAAELKALAQVEKVFHRISLDPRSALIFVPREVLEGLLGILEEHREAVTAFLDAAGLATVCDLLSNRLDADVARQNPRLAELGFSGLESFLAALESAVAGKSVEPPDPLALCSPARGETASFLARLLQSGISGEIDTGDLLRRFCSQGYLSTGDLLFVRVLPQKDFRTLEVIRGPLREIRSALARVRERFPGERIGLTGRPVLQADEMETTNDDMARAALLAVLGVVALFVIFFREVRRPLLAALTLVLGIVLTFGMVTVTVGHLNLLTMVFAVMLVSMGMEFGIHLIARYQEELVATGTVDESIRNALVTAGKGNITGAVTTAAAFYMTLFIDFTGLAELGFIAGTGLLLCMVAMNTLLPALLVITDRGRRRGTLRAPLRLGFLGWLASRPAWTLPAVAVSIVALLPFTRGLTFDANLLNLQAVGLSSVEYEKLILEKSGAQTWFAAFIADSTAEVRRITTDLAGPDLAGAIGRVESILDYVPDDQDEKLELIRQIGVALGGRLTGAGPAAGALDGAVVDAENAGDAAAAHRWRLGKPAKLDVERVTQALDGLLARLEALLGGTLRLDGGGARTLEDLTDTLDRSIEHIEADPELARQRLAAFQTAWSGVMASFFRQLAPMLDPLAVDIDSLDPVLRERVVSPGGTFLVHAYPRQDIWKEENMAEFIRVTRKVDAKVTGVPVQVHESTRIMKEGFLDAALYSLVAVFLLMLIDFRSIVFTLLAMIPVVLGLVWVVELMPAFGIAFNLANFFSIPILIGEGINGGVHIIHRFREDRSARVATRSTGTAVTLSYLNTLVGFGMLLLAHHRGLASLGAMMVLGSATSLVASTLVLPAILGLVERRRWHADTQRGGDPPGTPPDAVAAAPVDPSVDSAGGAGDA